jgi:CDP-diacylglycerol--serine O-phosphatidyltransferase
MENNTRIYKQVPNLLTLMNLCSGFISIVFVFWRNLEAAALFIIIAAVFDFLDGSAARILHATSEKGKVLDSLSDVVSFGVAPAAIIFLIIEYSLAQAKSDFEFGSASFTDMLFLFSPLIFLIASAWRLAEFTVKKNSIIFNGLPTPAATLFFAGLALIISNPEENRISDLFLELYIIIPAVLLISFMMVSKIRFISLKFREFGFNQNRLQYILIIFSALLLIIFKKFSISLIIIAYIIVSVVYHITKKTSDL